MNNFEWKYVWHFLLIFVIQALIVNNVSMWGYVTPMFYIMFVLSLPFQTPKWLVVFSGFLLGVCMDMFSGVAGMHAASLALIAFIRPLVMQLIPHSIIEEHMRPILQDMHFWWFSGYTFIMAFIHQFCLFFLDALSFGHFFHLIGMTLLNAFFTTLLIVLVQFLFYSSSKRY